jgi:hypothetical protein
MVLRRIASTRLIALAVVALAACSDDDSDSPGKQMPDASALDAGDSHARDAGDKPGHSGGARDAATSDASSTPIHPRMDAGKPADASAPHPRHDAGPSEDDGGALDCDAPLPSSVELATKPGSVLLIFDRSLSMADDWNGMPRWQAAGSEVIGALTPLQDSLDLGVILYPSVTPLASDVGLACGVDGFDSTEQIAFQPAAIALQKLQAAAPSGSPNPMYAPVGVGNNDPAVGATPTREAIDQANGALAVATFSGPAVVVLVTDGEPNCQWDQTHTTDMIEGWRSLYHVDTHVMLLPSTTSGQSSTAVAVGEALATAGGTTLIQANSVATLQQALTTAISHSLLQAVKSCSIELDPPADRPIDVQLVVVEHATGEREAAPHDLGKGSGWTISMDGANVKLTGALCEDAKRGRFDSIELAYGCETLAQLQTEEPSCPIAGTAYCDGACIDVVSDENHCSACDQRCGGGLTCCGGRCVDTSFTPGSCGACGSVCNGVCCGGECRPNDANNCGACDNACTGDTPCCCKGLCKAMQAGVCESC